MKITEATWERRNLGMNAWEICLGREDLDNIAATIESLSAPKFNGSYVCLKMPVGNLRMLHALEDNGFRFVETQFMITDCFKPEKILKYVDSIASNVERIELPKIKQEWRRIALKIEPGMFTTDRIALDPVFGEEVACKRYQNWVMDMFENPDAFIEITKVAGKEVAFALRVRISSMRSKGVLGGVFKEYLGDGYGIISMLDQKALQLGQKKKTVISSNNMDVFKLHQNCGRIVYDEMYVLRKIFSK